MAEKLNPFYKLLKAEVPINNTSELKEGFDSIYKALSDACELALEQSQSRKAACPNDGRKLQQRKLCPHVRR